MRIPYAECYAIIYYSMTHISISMLHQDSLMSSRYQAFMQELRLTLWSTAEYYGCAKLLTMKVHF